MKPIIGIVGRKDKSSEGNDIFYIHKNISDVIYHYGGLPIAILPSSLDQIDQLNKIDGFIMQGGDEYNSYDFKIIDYAYKNNVPMLGICLGMQAMAYYFDGKIEDLDNLFHKQKKDYVHSITINHDSKLYDILKEDEINVNSRHKSYVKDTKLKIVARAHDNLIEAVEDSSKDFFIGVQWHPETIIHFDKNAETLIKAFLDSCWKERF